MVYANEYKIPCAICPTNLILKPFPKVFFILVSIPGIHWCVLISVQYEELFVDFLKFLKNFCSMMQCPFIFGSYQSVLKLHHHIIMYTLDVHCNGFYHTQQSNFLS